MQSLGLLGDPCLNNVSLSTSQARCEVMSNPNHVTIQSTYMYTFLSLNVTTMSSVERPAMIESIP